MVVVIDLFCEVNAIRHDKIVEHEDQKNIVAAVEDCKIFFIGERNLTVFLNHFLVDFLVMDLVEDELQLHD